MLRRLLESPGFRRLFAVRLVSQVGDGMFQAGMAWLILLSPDAEQTPQELAALAALLLLPFSLLGPFTGVFLDRWSRRQVLVFGQLVRIALLVPLVVLATEEATPATLTLAVGCLAANRFLLSALSAGLPHVVPRNLLVPANALAPTAGTVAFLAGVGLGAVVIGMASGASEAALVGAGVAWGLAAGVALLIARRGLGPDRRTTTPLAQALKITARDLRTGVRHIAGLRRPRQAMVVMANARFWLGLWLVYVYLEFQTGGRSDLSLIFGAAGAGVIAAAPLTPLVRRKVGHESWLVTVLTVSAVAAGTGAVTREVWVTTGAAFVLGVSAQSLKICVDTVMQSDVDDAHVGLGFACYDVLFNVMFVAATAASVLFPLDVLPVAAALGVGVTAVWLGLANRSQRRSWSRPAGAIH